MIKLFLAFGFWLLAFDLALAVDRYISPGGTAAAGTCTTSAAPPCSWTNAYNATTQGDSIIFKTGTYGNAQFVVDGKNGTVSARIIIKAENERQAFIQGNGQDVFWVRNSSYLNIEGLRIENVSNPTYQDIDGKHTLFLQNSNNLIVRRNLIQKTNNHAESFNIYLEGVRFTVLEENECYKHHRNCMIVRNGDGQFGLPQSNNVFRRNYFHGANWDWPNLSSGGADTARCVNNYPSYSNSYQNNICDVNWGPGGFYAQHYTDGGVSGNRFFGNITIGAPTSGVYTPYNWDTYPDGDYWENNVGLGLPNPSGVLFGRGFSGYGRNITFKNNTAKNMNTGSGSGYGFQHIPSDIEAPGLGLLPPTPTDSLTLTNNLVVNSSGPGFYIDSHVTNWTVRNSMSFGASPNFTPTIAAGGAHYISSSVPATDPLGACVVYIPTGSPAKGAGQGGADIGANVLKAYSGNYNAETLTTTDLWDWSITSGPNRGQWKSFGAVIAGVNDDATQPYNIRNVHQRLGFGNGTCPSPSGAPLPPPVITITTNSGANFTTSTQNVAIQGNVTGTGF